MFSSNSTLRSLVKFQSLLSPLIAKPFTSHEQLVTKHTNKNLKKPPNRRPPQLKKQKIEEPKLYAAEKIAKVYSILKYSTWDSAQGQLEKLPFKWDSYTVNQVLKTHPPMQKAWLFFNWASSRKQFKHDHYTYTTMMDIFGEAGRIESMMYVFGQMKEKGVKIDVVTYTSLMHWLSKDGEFDGAVKLWEDMRKMGCGPTVVSYTAYVKILLDHKRVDEARQAYGEMLELGLKPNCHTYTVLMEFLASSGKWKEAMEIFTEMQEAGVQPDKATCNILVELCCCNAGVRWALWKILQYMKENFLVLRLPIYKKALESLRANGESTALVEEVNRHFAAEKLPHEDIDAENDPLPLDSVSLTDHGLVVSLLNHHNLIAIDSLLVQMVKKYVRLETWAVSEIIEVNNARLRRKGALLAYDYSVKMGIDIDKSSYLAVMGILIRENSFEKVVEIVERVLGQGLSLGTHLNSALIHRLGVNKLPICAVKVFELLPGEEKGTSEYTALISAYLRSGNLGMGIETFEAMKSKGLRVTLGTCCVLIDGLERCGDERELLGFLKKEKMRLEAESLNLNLSLDETICNVLFAGNFNIHIHV